MNKPAAPLDQLRKELAANPRLRLGMLLIGLLVLAWLWLVLGDWRAATATELAGTRERIARMEAMAGQDFWAERAEQAATLREALESEIPPAASPGLAQAAFQSWLTRQLQGTSSELRLSMEPPVAVEGMPGLVRTSATVSGGLATREALDLLRRIEGDRQLVVVPAIQIRSESNETLQMTVYAYYRLEPSAGESP